MDHIPGRACVPGNRKEPKPVGHWLNTPFKVDLRYPAETHIWGYRLRPFKVATTTACSQVLQTCMNMSSSSRWFQDPILERHVARHSSMWPSFRELHKWRQLPETCSSSLAAENSKWVSHSSLWSLSSASCPFIIWRVCWASL